MAHPVTIAPRPLAAPALDPHALAARPVDWGRVELGEPQRSGALTMIPLFGPQHEGFARPLSDLKLARVKGYGNVELENRRGAGVAIVPLHMGYIQDGAQNHALCRSAFLAGGQKLTLRDACCVQQSQGGYLADLSAWFFVLPLALREEALRRRGQERYSKLWEAIGRFNHSFGLRTRGHLEQVLGGRRAQLTQFASRFELLPDQTGALLVLGGRLVGLELAPNAAYFAETWTPLMCFCYGTAALRLEERGRPSQAEPEPELVAADLPGLRRALAASRARRLDRLRAQLEATPPQCFQWQEEERLLDLSLHTLAGAQLCGQVVRRDDATVYASLFARASYLPDRR